MLEKPALPDETLRACLAAEYGLYTVEITFLPLGADLHSAVYRVENEQAAPFFLKLRTAFDPTSVDLPRYLYDQGLTQVIAPLPTRSGSLWARPGRLPCDPLPFHRRPERLPCRIDRPALDRVRPRPASPALLEFLHPRWSAACVRRLTPITGANPFSTT